MVYTDQVWDIKLRDNISSRKLFTVYMHYTDRDAEQSKVDLQEGEGISKFGFSFVRKGERKDGGKAFETGINERRKILDSRGALR